MTIGVSAEVKVMSLHEGSVKKTGADTPGHNTKRAEPIGGPGRAEDELVRWRNTLSPNQRAKLEEQASRWGRNAGASRGSLVHGKSFRARRDRDRPRKEQLQIKGDWRWQQRGESVRKGQQGRTTLQIQT